MKTITATIQGGCFEVDDIPTGVKLLVKDYDIEGTYCNTMKDETGEYILREWEG